MTQLQCKVSKSCCWSQVLLKEKGGILERGLGTEELFYSEESERPNLTPVKHC